MASNEYNPYCATIPSVPQGDGRPVWSVMIPTYNCAIYLRETLASVLAQDPGPDNMQIEVVDDCSTEDDPAEVVDELGHGRIAFHRQPRNVGHTSNFNTCLQRSRGKLIHLLHGDDYVMNGFYHRMQCFFDENPTIGAAFCRDIRMDEHGHWQSISPLLQVESGILSSWLERIAVRQRLQAPSMVVRREVYERLGGFDHRISSYGEDWEMWVRIAAHYPVWYEVRPLAVYRIRSNSLSGHSVRTGENGRDIRQAININQSHLPAELVVELTNRARENLALACLRIAHRLLQAGDKQGSLAQMREAIKSRRSIKVLAGSILLFAMWAGRTVGLTRFISPDD